MVGKSGRLTKQMEVAARSVLLAGLVTCVSGCGMVATSQNMQGVRLYEQGQAYGAMEKFQKAMANNPNDANAYYNLASTLHRMGIANKDPNALKQAEQLYNECLNRNPNHTDCYRALAVLLVETDRSDRAFVLLKNWAIRSPQDADARVELARLYQEFGDTKTAELAVAAGSAVGPNEPACMDCHGMAAGIEGRLPTGARQLPACLHAQRLQPGPCQSHCGAQQRHSGHYGGSPAQRRRVRSTSSSDGSLLTASRSRCRASRALRPRPAAARPHPASGSLPRPDLLLIRQQPPRGRLSDQQLSRPALGCTSFSGLRAELRIRVKASLRMRTPQTPDRGP